MEQQMETTEVQELLLDVILEVQDEDSFPELDRAESFEEAGILTTDAGLVLRMRDGSEFQLTIRQSR
jgi:hypothetical protein